MLALLALVNSIQLVVVAVIVDITRLLLNQMRQVCGTSSTTRTVQPKQRVQINTLYIMTNNINHQQACSKLPTDHRFMG